MSGVSRFVYGKHLTVSISRFHHGCVCSRFTSLMFHLDGIVHAQASILNAYLWVFARF